MRKLCDQFGDVHLLYVIFGIVILFFLVLDLGVFVRKKKEMTIRGAIIQTLCWVSIALGFGFLVYHYHGKESGLQYISAYLMEYSLSADNLFVFIIILSFFKVSEQYYQKVLFFGILGAVIFRVIFILLGIVIVQKFEWTLYLFGAFLVITGVRMLLAKEESQFKPEKNFIYKFLSRRLNLLDHEADGNFSVVKNGKRYFSILFIVIAIIASTDLVFALDSIPAVFAISQDRLVIITSNVFAVMGLRAMFFLLSHAANKFDYLQEGISIVLIFIGLKMLIEKWIHISTGLSLGVIASVLFIAIMVSILFEKKENQ